MGVKIVGQTTNTSPTWPSTEWIDSTQDQRESVVNGQVYHFAMNERKSFVDEGVGAAIGAFGSTVPLDAKEDKSTGDSRF